jgi:hypothetical protein
MKNEENGKSKKGKHNQKKRFELRNKKKESIETDSFLNTELYENDRN